MVLVPKQDVRPAVPEIFSLRLAGPEQSHAKM